MGPLQLALASVHRLLQQAWSAPSQAALTTVAAAQLVLPLIQLDPTSACPIALVLAPDNLATVIQLPSSKTM